MTFCRVGLVSYNIASASLVFQRANSAVRVVLNVRVSAMASVSATLANQQENKEKLQVETVQRHSGTDEKSALVLQPRDATKAGYLLWKAQAEPCTRCCIMFNTLVTA
jgi:hypothetical protein